MEHLEGRLRVRKDFACFGIEMTASGQKQT